ncbi:MAG: cadherin domain-containing protein, partial [Planctomycetia bacterium]|nr:cadherin domain-containing protein [Planctomycetia bacterium]
NFTLSSGTLTNAATGVLNSNIGGGGGRTFSGSLINNGTVNLNTDTTFSTANGNYTNNNAFNIASSKTLTISGAAQVFTQAGGTLAVDGAFVMFNATFNFNDSTEVAGPSVVTGVPVLIASTLNIGAGSTGAGTFSTRAASTLTGNVAAAQTILVQGDNSFGAATLTAADGFTNAGTISLESVSGSGSASNLTVNSGTLTSSGTINFNVGGGGSRTLTTELANSGVVNVNTAATLGRPSADHSNSGTINVTGGDLTVSQSGASPTFANANSGIINIADTRTLNISGGELSNFSGGTLTGGTFNITGKLQFPGAAITTNAATIVLNGANSQIVNESDANALTNFATNAAAGSFTIQNGRNFTTAAGISEFANAGSMNITAGTTFTVSNGKKYSQTAGTTTLNGTLVTSNSVEVDIQGGTLQGSGDITGNLRNASQVNPGTSPGSLDVSGDYSQTADGILNIEIGGTTPITQFDQINIVGSASLNGTLNVSLIDPFVPNVADAFQIMTFGSHTGDFATKNGLTITSTLNFDPQFNVPGLLLDVNGSPVFTSNAAQSTAENTTAVTTVTTTDPDVPPQTVTFSIVVGGDSAKFQIVEATGVLSFVAAPDFEIPTDAGTNNVYNVTVQANDGHGGRTTQEIAVTVTPVNDNSPVFTSSATANVAENTTAVLTVIATDADLPGQSVSYSLTGGADQLKFSITSGGVLSFQTAPDFESPTDNGTNNIYNVQVTANDNNGLTTVQNIAVTVTAVNDNNPVFTSATTADVAENTTVVLTVTATDADQPTQSLTFSLVGGADQSKFSITSDGALTFQAAPDFENPTDNGTNNIYNVTVQASDGNGHTTTQDLVVTVTPVSENEPVFTSANTANVAENTTAVLTVIATDADLPAQTVTFTIFGGDDASKFSITSEGVLTFQTAPDFETPTDVGANNVYNVIVRANDGNLGVTNQSIAVTVTPVNDNSPVFTSVVTANVATNTTAVRTVTATDADLPVETITFSITGGADQSKFSITSGGVLTFNTTPDFATPTDVGTDNVYNVQVTANDNSGRTTAQDIAVTVTDIPINPPVFTSSVTVNVAENSTAVLTVVATDPDAGQTATFSIFSGADASKFSITGAGVLTFNTAPDFENPTDSGTNNIYNVTVQANDGNGGLATQDIAVTVTAVNDNNPVFTSSATFNVAENTTAVGTVVATDADMPSQTVNYSLSGGADQTKFSITSGGVLTFQASHDFETPNDVGTNNVYNVQVTANDGNGRTTTQDIAVSVTPVNDNNPVFTSATTVNVAENSTAVLTVAATDADMPSQSISFSLVGGADQAKFSITSGGALTFQTAPDFEAPTDNGTNNVYNVTVGASDGNGGTTTQNIAVTVTAVNDNNPAFTSAATFNVAENSTAIATVSATDADSPAQSVTFSLTGGADQSKFSITSGGVLTFQAAHDFENPNDVGTNNVYNVQVTASDGNGGTTTQNIAVSVTNLAPSTPTDGDPAGSTIIVNSANGTTVGTTAVSTDPAGGTVTFTLTNNAGGRFTINNSSGVVTVANSTLITSASNHTITVQASDGVLTSTADFTINVTNISADFGDAPTAAQTGFASSYPTGFSNNGAFHLPTGPTLGATRDVEFDGQPNLAASGDDTTGGTDDEDGITFLSNFETGRGTAIRINVQNAAVTGSFLDAWIDWNRDGDWNDAGEQISAGQALVSGNNNLTINTPTTASLGDTYARFRLSTTGGLSPTGQAAAGEVEDYMLTVVSSAAVQLASRALQTTASQTSGGNIDVSFTAGENRRAVSDDGRFVVFVSDSNNLVPEDTNNAHDVFRFDRLTGEIVLVSVNRTGTSSSTTGPVGTSLNSLPMISADGQVVSFLSFASDLTPTSDTNNARDVFVRNLRTNSTSLVSVNQANNGTGNGDSSFAMLSADGNVVAFLSAANNLAPNDTNGTRDVFVRNLLAATPATAMVTLNAARTASGNGDTVGFALSADGGSVAFASTASNLTSISDTNANTDVFVRNLNGGATTLVSISSTGAGNANGFSAFPSISANGQVVSFAGTASNLVANDNNGTFDVFVRLLSETRVRLVSINTSGGSGNAATITHALSADGTTVAFSSDASNLVASDTNGVSDVFVRNATATTPVTRLVSAGPNGVTFGNGLSVGPVVSANGRFVAFQSAATNLTSNPNGGLVRNVFLRDMNGTAATQASIATVGATNNDSGSGTIVMSADGRTVAYGSAASNLVVGDNNSTGDVFTFTMPGVGAKPSAPLDVNVAANTIIENAATGAVVGITAGVPRDFGGVKFLWCRSLPSRFAIDCCRGG